MAVETTDRIVDVLSTKVPIDKEAIRGELFERAKATTGYLLNHIDVAVIGVTNVAATFCLVTVFLYLFLKYGKLWLSHFAALAPVEPRIVENLFKAVHDSAVANVNGALVVVVGQGAMMILGFWLVGVQSPVLWGAVGGLCSIIPLVGPPIVWIPVAIGYLLVGDYWRTLFISLWGALITGSLDNILRPLAVGAREKHHPMLIAIGTLGGTYAMGALGIFLGPLIVSLALAIVKEIQALATVNGYDGSPDKA